MKKWQPIFGNMLTTYPIDSGSLVFLLILLLHWLASSSIWLVPLFHFPLTNIVLQPRYPISCISYLILSSLSNMCYLFYIICLPLSIFYHIILAIRTTNNTNPINNTYSTKIKRWYPMVYCMYFCIASWVWIILKK